MNILEKWSLDVLILEYFEGNLNPGEQDYLSQYLDQHPEFSSDMHEWSKTYFMREAALADYGIAKKLIKPDRSAWKRCFDFL